MKVYFPEEIDLDESCVVFNNDFVRVYDKTLHSDGFYYYTDYFNQLGYIKQEGKISSDTYNSFNIICNTDLEPTTNIYYRTDIDSILITFAIFISVVLFALIFLFKSFFKGWGR